MLKPLHAEPMGAMTPDDKQFFKALGRRVAHLRQQAGMSQQAVAAELGIAQQTLAHYEVGRLRLPVSLLPRLAELFGVPADDLLGLNGARTSKRGPTPKLQQQIERLHGLPKAKQKLVMEMLEGVLMQHR
ncbi:MAG TPA: helix-turn-helix domain-containing protein [Gammaproteobacteria bacterium]|nr:helix-turn-helix domain-containing protein [Gammaproteobacteria bacterium]